MWSCATGSSTRRQELPEYPGRGLSSNIDRVRSGCNAGQTASNSRYRKRFLKTQIKVNSMKSPAFRLVAIMAVPLLTAVMALAAGPQDTSALHPPKGAKVAIVVFE